MFSAAKGANSSKNGSGRVPAWVVDGDCDWTAVFTDVSGCLNRPKAWSCPCSLPGPKPECLRALVNWSGPYETSKPHDYSRTRPRSGASHAERHRVHR